MTIESDDVPVWFKSLPVLATMSANLAMVDSFTRRSMLNPSDADDEDRGFWGIAPGSEQVITHNRSVSMIVVALLYLCLESYFGLKTIDRRLEDPCLEAFLNGLGRRRLFLDGMEAVRKGVFHVRSLRSWRRSSVSSFDEVCAERGGVPAVMSELRGLLYEFTEKVYSGKLRIWPDSIYEQRERMEKEAPEVLRKLERGEIEFSEYMEAYLSLCAGEGRTPRLGPSGHAKPGDSVIESKNRNGSTERSRIADRPLDLAL